MAAGQRAAVVDIAKTGPEALKLLQGVAAVIHGATFDLAFLGHRGVNLGKVHDTQQAARLTIGASKCSLAAAVKHYLKVDLDKELQASRLGGAGANRRPDPLRRARRHLALAALPAAVQGPRPAGLRLSNSGRRGAGDRPDEHRRHRHRSRSARRDFARARRARRRSHPPAYQAACRAMGRPELAEKVPRSPSEIAEFLKAVLTEAELARWKRGQDVMGIVDGAAGASHERSIIRRSSL